MSEVKHRLSAEQRQEEIIRATLDLAGERSVDDVTTQDIASAIGVTQGAIFRHFPSKNMIWLAVVHWVRARLMSAVDMAASQGADPLDAIERIFFTHLGFVEKYPAMPGLLFSDQLLRKNRVLKQLIKEILSSYEEKIVGLLAQAKTQGLTRADLDEHSAAALFTAVIQGLVIRVALLEAKPSLLAEGRAVFPLFLNSITPQGKERR